MSLDAYPLIRHWLSAQDGRLVVHTGKVDIGQRISTALVRIAAEELSMPPDLIDVAQVRTGSAPDEGITSGSNSLEQSGHALRLAAATLRGHVLALAAGQLGADAATLDLAEGYVTHRNSNRKLALTELAAALDPALPVDPDAQPLPASAVAAVGALPPRGLREMVTGSHCFVHDLDVPGMLHARVVRPPHALARLRGLDPEALSRLTAQGIRVVRDGSFLAVAGPLEWPVVQAAERLARGCDWDMGAGLAEGDIFAMLQAPPAARLPVIDGKPQVAPVPPPPQSPQYAARFERPYQLHAALGPSAALADWRDGRLTIRTHSQGIYPLRDSIADSLELPLEAVELVHVPGSGCYGHNGADDAAYEAALVARAIPDTPILLKWSRADEHAWEPSAPAMAVTIAANLGPDHRIAQYSAEVFSDTHRGRPRPGPDRAGPARLLANRFRESPIGPYVAEPNMGRHAGMHRNLDPIYSFDDKRLVKNLLPGLPLRTSAMRCLGAAVNVFAIESFMTEMADRAGADPLAFRRRHLDDPRAIAVLDRLAEAMADRPGSAGRGIAYAQYKNAQTRVGVCVDLDVDDAASVRLRRALIVADAGRVVDPDGLVAQLEGGFIQGASWALNEEVAWDRDGVQTRDWDSYRVIRFDNIPEIEVLLIARPDAPSVGAGEASPGPAIAAIANAVHDATGLRLRRLPFTPDAIRAAALAG